MWPEVHADLNTLAASALRELAAAIRTRSMEVLGQAVVTPEERAEVARFSLIRTEAKALADAKDADAAARAALEAEGDEPVVPEPVVTPAPVAEVTAPAPATEVVPEPVLEPALAIQVTTGQPSTPTVPALNSLSGLVAGSSVPDMPAGTPFNSWAELSVKLTERANMIGDSAGAERFQVARINGAYPADRVIADDGKFQHGLARFGTTEEITAALCPPATPYYGLACDNTARRPVFGSMGSFAAPRGSVSIPVSPTLADITGQNAGYGQWTFANDDDGSAKNCAVVNCNSWNNFQLYAVWRCLTIKNLLALTYPELVEAYLNRLAAAQARFAEILLLEAMATATTSVQAPSLGYGTATSFTTLVMEYLALYQETQRWDITEGMEAWMPRWVLTGLQVDLARRRKVDGAIATIQSQATIETMLRSAGMNPHWFIDTPSWAPSIPAVQTAGTMNRLPTTIPVILAPPGKFAVIDRGNVGIGVGGNLYRDTNSNRTNTYTFFVETAEGLVNTTSCPAHLLRIPVCHNGVQVDDRLVACDGIDELGWQS